MLFLSAHAIAQPLDEPTVMPVPASMPTTAPAAPYDATPIVVQTGIMLEQIIEVNQRDEAFSIGAVLQMRWHDANLAFVRQAGERPYLIFHDAEFAAYARQHGARWPDFSITNQQGRRWTQNLRVAVRYDGDAFYYERFTATLQAPDFDFRHFPFDRQVFFVRVQCLLPAEQFVFEANDDLSAVGQQLGEEEWWIAQQDNSTDIVPLAMGASSSRYNFQVIAERHRLFYYVRIILPLALIVLVSYMPFFLKDYAKRIEVGITILLILVGFNFVIGGDLPRLGYVTFLDFLLMIAFILTALMVPLGVILKRLDVNGRPATSAKLDRVFLLSYPAAYVLAIAAAIWWFLL